MLAQADPANWDVLLIQEPWIDGLDKTRGNGHWRIFYPSNHLNDGHARTRSVFLVNTSLATDAVIPLNFPSSDITAIRLKGKFGNCSLFNIYNDCTNNNTLTVLGNYLDNNLATAKPNTTDHMLWLGDFNRHHPLWEDDRNCTLFESNAYIKPYLDLIQKYKMDMALPLGIPTLQTVTNNRTRPDNVWRTSNEYSPITKCYIDASIRPPMTDHMPVITILDLPIPRSITEPSRNFKEANWETVALKLETRLNDVCPAGTITAKITLEERVNILTDTIDEVLDTEIPR